jgi:SAM-dependent methyltransferase
MPPDITSDIHRDLEPENPARLEFIARAYRTLPEIKTPRILDVGCGGGKPTIELAKLSGGEIVGLDINQSALDELSKRAEEAGLADRVRAVKGSMLDLDFPDESFDILWSEGSIFAIGFERGLREWRRFIKPSGFLVVHDMVWLRPDPPREIREHWRRLYPGIRAVEETIQRIPAQGYALIAHFPLSQQVWWHDYCGPLQRRIRELRAQYADDPAAQRTLDDEQREVDLYRKYADWYGSAYFVMQKQS